MRSVLWLLAVLCASSCVDAGPDTSICNPANYQANAGHMPSLGQQATMRVEVNDMVNNITWDAQEFVDYPGNRYAEHQWVNGTHTYKIIKFATDELITIEYPADENPMGAWCTISKASTSILKYELKSYQNGTLHVRSPLGTIGVNSTSPLKVLGPVTLADGIKANGFETCFYDAASSTTAKLTVYFSDPNKWYYSMGKLAVPIRASGVGSMKGPNGVMISFHGENNYADYRPRLLLGDVDSFKVPEGIFCAGDKTSMPMPPIPSHFSLRSEIVDRQKKYVNWIKEFYDNQLNLTRYDFQPNSPYSVFGNRRLTRVHDFNNGIAYIMDPEIGNCTVQPIQKYGYDDKNIGPYVRIRSPKEFLDLGTYNYTYVGQRKERGIACDVWVTQRTDWPPPGPSYPTTWEYYFSAGVVESIGTTSPYSVPVKLHIIAGNPPIDVEYNFYQFDSDRSAFHDYNIGQCFNASTRADYVFIIPGNYRGLLWKNIVVFKRLFTLSVSSSALVSPLRVTNIQTSFNNSGLVISFSLLDKPPIQGDVNNVIIQPTLDQAVANLKPSLDAKNLTILISDPAIPGGFRNLIVSSYSVSRGPPLGPGRLMRSRRDTSDKIVRVKFQDKNDKGMTSGTLAGVAVGLLIAGIVVGLLVFIIIDKIREGGGSAPATVSNPGYEQ